MTPRRLDIIRFFNGFQRSNAMSPTMREVADALNISRVTVLEHLRALVRDGLLTSDCKHRSRAYRLTDKAIAALGPAPEEWFDVTSRMPDADTTVLVHVPKADEPVWLGYFDGERWCYADGLAVNHPVRQWRNIPGPPNRSSKSQLQEAQA